MKDVIGVCVLVVVCALDAAAQTAGGIPSATGTESRGFEPLLSNGGFLAPFKYIAPAVNEDQANDVKRSPEQTKIMDFSRTGNYQEAGTQGLELMTKEPVDEALQLVVANSLAWTGRIKEAVSVYQGLSSGSQASPAAVGLANIHRWRGRDDLARPMYQKVLSKEPTNADALEGLQLAERELSPRTILSASASSDSSDLKRRMGSASHRWRDKSGAQILEVETSGFFDWTLTEAEPQRDVTLKFQDLSLALKPSVELSMPSRLNRTLYGSVKVKVWDDQITLGVGRLNWGKTVANPVASRNGLAAGFLSAELRQPFAVGTVVGRLNYYDISDQNMIWTSSLNFDSSWRPLGSHFKPFAGFETREAALNKPTYWSPSQGSGSAYAGLMGEWGDADWNLFASVQLGSPLYGDAGKSWSVSAGGKRWVTSNVALGFSLWSMESWRDNSSYKAQAVGLNLEKIWH